MKNANTYKKSTERTAVVGARGYAGLELARLLLKHPRAELSACFATSGFDLGDFLPEKKAQGIKGRAMESLPAVIEGEGVGTVFLATPAEVSLDLAPKLLESGVDVIDLSGAFRLKTAAPYEKWYGFEHEAPELLASADYGLAPWAGPAAVEGPRLVANPGCFATAVLMAILPLLKGGVVEPSTLVIDAKSGTSGAGKKAEERLLHCEVEGNCLPYRIGRHQHEPEIRLFAGEFADAEIAPFFTTHLLDVRRGIVASHYARVKKGTTLAHVEEAYAKAYAEEKLVEFAAIGKGGEKLLSLRRVVGSARTQIAYELVDDRLYVFSLIDNLLKGAASQAVENFNRLLQEPTWLGLTETEGVI